jgi:hypothetical protein
VGAYGCLRDLREPEVRGRASDGATAATDVVFERETLQKPARWWLV